MKKRIHVSVDDTINIFQDLTANCNKYKYFNKYIKKICGVRPSKIIRLHNYIATDEIHKFLFKNGIKYLLISKEMDSNMHMKNTDIRLEKCDNVIRELDELKNNELINVFTHEWMFYDDYDGTIKKIEDCCIWKDNNNSKFI